MLKAIIFDMDGVLVDSMRFQADAWAKAFQDAGINIVREDIYELEGSNDKRLIKSIFKEARKEPEPEHFERLPEKKRDLLEFDRIKPFEGIPECLDELKRHFRLAMVSGSNRNTVGKIVDKFFSGYFDVVINGSDLERGKPDPDPYLKALEMLGLTKNECMVIENAPLGITAAKRAGLYCVAVASMLEPEKVQHADLVLEDHASLFDYLKSLIPGKPQT
ncbi:HAD family hydrolase [Methanosarcina mazei]|jgi:beta-phosphoglucomutase|uniref:HAD family hydrolase n=8 Tax=Methanosarcina mazei TaxID=2209 RepID=A0A0F8MWL8_METMZ|nr:HAD family phosphatase [Methanosarcina mazei]AAM31331.1 Beta-phosphoglucomutase [Methanosarcina mazei Go1]AGF97064.1 Beta-phosphoglucomutase [Methanosarcina mazei Tuc01]AKB41946.1 Beta-phosphoglucomutase [Methanosarcina mazei WWM610]AKB62883.1 Beta-phosphoglucomutase [Methanosarcina mazei SarPi]AKB66230.1 Beta-phosphoglucomutase [Methanosarcina mazei S-6]